MKDSRKVGLLVFGAAVFYVGLMIAFSVHPLVGKLMVDHYRHTHIFLPLQVGAVYAQAPTVEMDTVPVPKEGSTLTDPATGKKYRVGRSVVWPAPSGYRLCLPNKQFARAGSVEDVRAAHVCINGGPVGPGCPEAVSLLCNAEGRQIEQLAPVVEANGAIRPPTYRDPATGEEVKP